jgi:hypothetical protein
MPWNFTTVWANRRREVEQALHALLEGCPSPPTMPWHSRGQNCAHISNSAKVAYMELVMHEHKGVATVTRFAEGSGVVWHRVERFTVAKDKREAFDAGFLPSASSCRVDGARMEPKTVNRLWQHMGLMESTQPDGALLFVFSQRVFATLKQQIERKPLKRKHSADESTPPAPVASEVHVARQRFEANAAKQRAIVASHRAIAAEQRAIAAEQRAIAAEQKAIAADQHALAITSRDCMSVHNLMNSV